MTTFTQFLAERLEAGGFTTEDALAGILPLIRQVVAAHRAGKVAPLQGVNSLQVEANRLWYEESLARPALLENRKVRDKEEPASQAIEVIGQCRLDTHVEEGHESADTLLVGRRGEPFPQPVYFPGYVAWEHELGHHDPLADVFVLGLILASLTCSLDLNDPEDLTAFVQNRRNLFGLNARLHPVLAKAIVRMTELKRGRRPQDLAALLHTLENYRDQDIDFDFDLARMPNFATADHPGRRAAILSCLQQRLFDRTRRNRLLHFRATTQTVNLTWASVPLSFDVRNIRPEQILTWGQEFKTAVIGGGSISLNKHLRFEEALYLPGQLDAIRNEARRDQTEYGFAQLRLAIAFLRWANLKETPPERYDSPLVLLPVRLTKTKGVRDVFTLEPLGTQAEINPVVRFLLKQLYAVELPDAIDLAESSLDDLHAFLAGTVQSSEPAVTIEKIDKPRINLIHAKAQRRLEQYRRRVRLSGRGVRTYLDIDYSYDRTNYHPLGLRIFQMRIVPAEPRLRTIVDESPRQRAFLSPAAEPPENVKERRLYSPVEEETNPFRWEFDLCNITLGNFHYRKMSLVRDYAVLLDRSEEHSGFDAVFSLEPRDVSATPPKSLPLDDSYPIVNCDPTQASAIALARTGKHFIIQGPPGTGKSQTIANLIADYAGRGLRVLFVCEKRAAIDVVYHRLKQVGLHELCCLIHDAQDDKKEFIADLKATYEAFQGYSVDSVEKTETERRKLLERFHKELAPLERFQSAMTAAPPQAGVPMYRLVERAVELHESAADLSATEKEKLPGYSAWDENQTHIERVHELLEAVQPDSVLAHHPLRLLHSRFGSLDRPHAAIQESVARIKPSVSRLLEELKTLAIPAECWESLDKLAQLMAYADQLRFLAEHDLLGILKSKSELAKKLTAFRKRFTTKGQELEKARAATSRWRHRLSPSDTKAALDQAKAQEHSPWRFIQPSWWRLRGLMNRSYDFAAHQVRPPFSQVLEALLAEYEREAEREALENEARAEFSLEGSFADFSNRVAALVDAVDKLPPFWQTLHNYVVNAETGNDIVLALLKSQGMVAELIANLGALLDVGSDLSLPRVQEEVQRIEQSLNHLPSFLPLLKALGELPAALSAAWRRLALTMPQLEAALASRTIDELLAADPAVARFTAAAHAKQIGKLEPLHDEWQSSNAATVRDRVCRHFLDNLRLASLPHSQLTAEQKEFKTRYNRGRKELEHEFNKTMRYRSIRDLVDDETGLVVRDLKPVWLMSPLSVSDALPLAADFDVVIFDEASQVTLEESVPTIFRSKQVLVVGDEMQLPPTSFFASRGTDDEEQLVVEEDGQKTTYDLSSNSLLNHAARNLPATLLGWHYRSRSESLISFSNAAFYQGRLLTVPEVALAPAALSEIVIREPADGATNVARLLDRPVSFHYLEKGLYDQRRNTVEADYIAHLVRGLIADPGRPSLGIIAFSEAQQNEIEQALNRLAQDDDAFADRLEAEYEREHDGQFLGLLVKNLENIQGDERDVILLSVCYGYGPNGKMLMNFGPINQNGGERRLNVAFSRAKKHMALVSSIRPPSITNDYNDGARALKNYLRYAEALSAGNGEAARRVLREMNAAESGRQPARGANAVVEQLAARLRERGFEVDRDVGQSSFRCDLAIRSRDRSRYALGILVDTGNYYANANLLERDLLRPRLLRAFDWNVLLVLSKEWYEDSQAVLKRIEAEIP